MSTKTALSFSEISNRLKGLALPEVDLVVGIATGGTVPASLVAHQLGCNLQLVHINFRNEQNQPQHEEPVFIQVPALPKEPRRILLVDDVSVTGKTFQKIVPLLAGHKITTLVMKGKADFVLFPEVKTCVSWPWKLDN